MQIDESDIYPYKMVVEICGVFSQNKLIVRSEGKDKQEAIKKMIRELEYMIKLSNESIEKIKNI